MQCPVCENERLEMSERQGIEIDYCPKCRGVWLDRGELDKIIERTAEMVSVPGAPEQGRGAAAEPPHPEPPAPPAQQPRQPAPPPPPPQAPAGSYGHGYTPPHGDYYQRPPRYKDEYYYQKKKKGPSHWLKELFD